MMQPIPAPGYRLTAGRTPRTGETMLHVQFRNGLVSKHTYTARQLRWDDTGHAFDVVAARRVG